MDHVMRIKDERVSKKAMKGYSWKAQKKMGRKEDVEMRELKTEGGGLERQRPKLGCSPKKKKN
jgi:hypothetical protein